MTRIRVNTEDLKAKAKDFESAADAFNRAGDDIAAVAAAMPSYDGQLSGPARKAGAEIQSQARDMRTALANDAQLLKSAAQGFDAVENQTVDAISSASSIISLKNVPLAVSAQITSGGNKLFGYEYLSENIIVIWLNGKYMRIDISALSPEDWKSLMAFISKVDTFDTTLSELPGKLSDVLIGAFLTFAGIITAGVLLATLIGAVAGGVLLGGGIYKMGISGDELYKACEKLIKQYENAGSEFDKLYNSQGPGIQEKT